MYTEYTVHFEAELWRSIYDNSSWTASDPPYNRTIYEIYFSTEATDIDRRGRLQYLDINHSTAGEIFLRDNLKNYRRRHMSELIGFWETWVLYRNAIFNLDFLIGTFRSHNENALRWRQRHYLNHCLQRSLTPVVINGHNEIIWACTQRYTTKHENPTSWTDYYIWRRVSYSVWSFEMPWSAYDIIVMEALLHLTRWVHGNKKPRGYVRTQPVLFDLKDTCVHNYKNVVINEQNEWFRIEMLFK